MGEHVCVRSGSRTDCVVLLPGLGASTSSLVPLANHIQGTGAVHILDLVGITDAERELLSVESLAKRCLSVVDGFGGADVIVGYSFGGLVALEMARLAGAQGSPLPILIDAAPEQSHWPTAAWLSSLWLRSLRHLETLARLPPRQALAELVMRGWHLILRIQRRTAAAATTLESGGDVRAKQHGSAAERMLTAYMRYRPTAYSGRVMLIEASDPSFSTPVSVVWRRLAPELEVLRYPGHHLDAVYNEAALEPLAALLNACLASRDQLPAPKPQTT